MSKDDHGRTNRVRGELNFSMNIQQGERSIPRESGSETTIERRRDVQAPCFLEGLLLPQHLLLLRR